MTKRMNEGSIDLLNIGPEEIYPAILVHLHAKVRVFTQVEEAEVALKINKANMD